MANCALFEFETQQEILEKKWPEQKTAFACYDSLVVGGQGADDDGEKHVCCPGCVIRKR